MAATKATKYLVKDTAKDVVKALACLILLAFDSHAAILPEERTDIMYHRYDGGGMVIDGPSVLIRKNFADKFSVSGNYYIDKVSSASIDVQTITNGASQYAEERTEKSGDLTYLHNKTTLNIGHTTSSENDYEAKSYRLDMSHSFFSEMTTINIGFSQGNDDITSSEDADFAEKLERKHYRVGIAQVLNKALIANINYESIIDDGYLQNPYRKILTVTENRPTDGSLVSSSAIYDIADERYPNTRNSDAVSLKLAYHLPWSAAIKTRLGYFSDSWGINGYSSEIDYSHKYQDNWLFDFRIRYYEQGDADFYRNVFYQDDSLNFAGRDKELSEYNSTSLGVSISYHKSYNQIIESLKINAQYDHLFFNYDNFHEVTNRLPNGNRLVEGEPLYEFDAYALRVFLTLYY